MSNRTGMSQVKFKVRHNALLLREFTVDDMVRATGLNPESVRTELQRMRREKLLASEPLPAKPKKPGGRQSIYRLTADPEARLVLSESIEGFYPSPDASHPEEPTSRYYLFAQQLFDRAEKEVDQNRERLLVEAERQLQMAQQAEGGGLASDSVRAYLQCGFARIAYLRGQYDEAERNLEAPYEFFLQMNEQMIVRRIEEFRLCIKAWKRFMQQMPGSVSEVTWARCLLGTLADNHYEPDSPLISLLLRLLQQLSQTADDKVRAAALEVAQRMIGKEAAEAYRSEQKRLSHEIAILRQSGGLLQFDRFRRVELQESPFGQRTIDYALRDRKMH